MKNENKEVKLDLPYRFETKITKQGLITIPHILNLKRDCYYLFNFKPKKGEIIYSQIKKIRHSGESKYISCRVKTPFMHKEEEVEVTIVKEFIGGKELIIEEEDGYNLLSNQSVRSVFLYDYRDTTHILSSETENLDLLDETEFTNLNCVTDSIEQLKNKFFLNYNFKEGDFYDICRDGKYSIIRFILQKRVISMDILQKNPTPENKEAYETMVTVIFLIITKTDYLQFIMNQDLRTRTKLFLNKFMSVASYAPHIIKEFESLIQNEIFEIIMKSDESSRKFNSLDDPRFWFFIPAEFHKCSEKLQMYFYSGEDYLFVEELIEMMETEENLEDAKQLVMRTIEWLYKHQVIKVGDKEGKKTVELYKLE